MTLKAGPDRIRQNVAKFTGDHTARVPPVPIPNTAVKPRRADGTARVGAWEIRTSPVICYEWPASSGPFLVSLGCITGKVRARKFPQSLAAACCRPTAQQRHNPIRHGPALFRSDTHRCIRAKTYPSPMPLGKPEDIVPRAGQAGRRCRVSIAGAQCHSSAFHYVTARLPKHSLVCSGRGQVALARIERHRRRVSP